MACLGFRGLGLRVFEKLKAVDGSGVYGLSGPGSDPQNETGDLRGRHRRSHAKHELRSRN